MKFPSLLILLTTLLVSGANATLITNGDFEVTELKGKQWKVYSSIEGWTTTQGHGIELQRNTIVRAQSGNQYVELDSHSRRGPRRGNSAMTQSIATEVGQDYWLSFYYLPRTNKGGNDNGLAVYWDAFDQDFAQFDPWNEVFAVDNLTRRMAPEWEQYSVRLTATTELTALSFAGTGRDNTLGAFIDNVSLVKAVPVPATVALLGLGLVGLVLSRKR